jgi:hypothetical protein
MTFIVECVHGTAGEPGYTRFDLTTWQWEKLLPLAEQFGWQPAGCIYHTRRRSHAQPHYGKPTDYGWDEWARCKEVASADARNLSAALRRIIAVRARPTGGPFLISESGFVDRGMAFAAQGLADFADRGAFVFAVDD